MAFARPNLTRPSPAARPRPVRHQASPDTARAAGSSLPAQFGTWNFTGQVYISFDPPTTTNPTWLEVTEFVDLDASTVSITRGRQDGFADVSVGTCQLVVDNTDGRWTPSNPNGAWFGLIRKGIWLRVDVLPPSGVVSRRFTGFVTALPTGWSGLYATTTISASDRFQALGQAAPLPTMASAEVLYDTSTGPLVAAHYPLSESAVGNGIALSFGDVSGNASPPLVPVPFGSNQAGYLSLIKAQGATAPGFDGTQCLSFAPSALGTGTALQTTLEPWNTYNGFFSYGVLELWLQTTFVNTTQAFASLFDPSSGCAAAFGVDASGYLTIETGNVTTGGTYAALNNAGPFTVGSSYYGFATGAGVPLNDGNWHYLSIATAVGPTAINPIFVINIDGKTVWIGIPPNNVSPDMNTLYIGGTPGVNNSYNCFTGNIAGVSWILSGDAASNYPAHYRAGYDAFNTESVDARIARIARYAGIPEPTTLQVPAVGFNPVPVYNGAYGPWTNLGACIHQCGRQSIVGRAPLDVMREAARTEAMPLYIDRAGYLTIQPCTTRYNTPSSWSIAAADLDPSTTFTDDYQYLKNQLSVTPNGGATQVINGAAGLASQDKYGIYSDSIQTASVNTTEAANLALSVIGANADPVPRIAPLVVEAASLATQADYGAAWYDAVLASDVSTVATVTALPPQAPAPSMSVFLEGYTETIGQGQHTFSFSTSPQTYANAFQLDSPTLGVLDTPGIVLAY